MKRDIFYWTALVAAALTVFAAFEPKEVPGGGIGLALLAAGFAVAHALRRSRAEHEPPG